jgi:hypothetical protein
MLGTSDYTQKIFTLLEDKAYARLKKDPTSSIERKTFLLLKESQFAEEVCQQLRPQGSTLPRRYGLPKIHKLDVPLRPTVSTAGSLTYRLAQHLSSLLSYYTGHSPRRVQSSTQLVHTLRSLRVDAHDIMESFDVVSLFIHLPIKETMDLLGCHFEEDSSVMF